jgi:hypothetical protein
MGRSIRFVVFALLVITTGARAAAQSHGGEVPAKKKEGAHETPASTKAAPVATPAKKESPLGAPAHKEEVPRAPAPAATARAVAAAIADAQARRRQVSQQQRNRQQPMPVEKRLELVWQTPDPRVALVWPPIHTYRLSWDDHAETPREADAVPPPAAAVRAGSDTRAAAGRR